MAVVGKKVGSRRVDVREALYKASIGWAVKKGYGVIREHGLNRKIGRNRAKQHLRADLHLMTSRGTIEILEIKSCPADLKADKKLQLYVPYAHRLTVVCTVKTWKWGKKNYKFPPSCGVMILDPKSGYLKSVRPTKPQKMDPELHMEAVLRRAYRNSTHTRYNTRRYRVFLDEDNQIED